MVSSKQLGESIRKARKAAGITQDELSDRAGLAYSTLAKIEQGAIKSPSFFTVQAISAALEMTIEELIGGPSVVDRTIGSASEKARKDSIKFVYSDLNGVLVRFYHKAFASVSKETGRSFDLIETTFWHYNEAINTGEITINEFNKLMAKRLDVEKIDWTKHYLASVEPITQMAKLIEEVHDRVKVGLLTNTMPSLVGELAERGVLPNIKFDAIVDSSVVGYVKPDSKIYEIAEEKAGCSGSEILFIDDSRTNLTAAEKFGWQVRWFDDYNPAESVRRLREFLTK